MVAPAETPSPPSPLADPAPGAQPRPRGLPRSVHVVLGLLAPAGLLIYDMAAASPLTIDDAYISFRYARNLAHGLGLVYNAGERIEGYTNFLWTLILAAGIKLGIDPHTTAKLLGGAAALGALWVVWRLSEKLLPFRYVPALATWLLASSMTFAGYSVLGLETALFIFLVLLGLLLTVEESERPERFPYSGLVYALAALTRPEAPLFLGLAMLVLGKRMFRRQNLLRGAIFAAVVGMHLLWRHSYYGAWLPNTFSAKTGSLSSQIPQGIEYVGAWLGTAGAIFWFALLGLTLTLSRRTTLGLAVVATAGAVCLYVVVVGGDWMPVFRFMAAFEPFAFLLVDLGLRAAAESKNRAVLAALALFAAGSAVQRRAVARAQTAQLAQSKRDWDASATVLANWFREYGHPGTVALGDIGYVGWTTGYPILDILGLVDPVIARLPGGYTTKVGPKYVDYFFERMPEYFILISAQGDCLHPFHPSIAAVYRDPAQRLQANYAVVHRIRLTEQLGWCVYQKHPTEVGLRVLFDFERGYAGWQATGNAFASGPSSMHPANEQPLTGGEGRFVASSFSPTLFDAATGTLTSPAFTLDRSRLALRVGGGAHPDTRVELLVDGQVVEQARGAQSESLARTVWDVGAYLGKTAQLRLIDEDAGPWGHILLDQVELFDTP